MKLHCEDLRNLYYSLAIIFRGMKTMRIAGAVRAKWKMNKNVRKKTLREEIAWETHT
jgi:hypothetical protein